MLALVDLPQPSPGHDLALEALEVGEQQLTAHNGCRSQTSMFFGLLCTARMVLIALLYG
jgi:hypothetical protein